MDQPRENDALTIEELSQHDAVELPRRELMLAVTLLGIPVVGLTGLNLSLNLT